MEGTSRRGRPNREWLDEIKEWCQEDIHTLSRKAQDRDLWRRTVNYGVNTNGQEPMERWMDLKDRCIKALNILRVVTLKD